MRRGNVDGEDGEDSVDVGGTRFYSKCNGKI